MYKVYQYDAFSDSWTPMPNYSGNGLAGEFVVSTGARAFAGTGFDPIFNTTDDLWEFAPDTTSRFSISDTICSGNGITPTLFSSTATPTSYLWSVFPAGSVNFNPNNTVAAPQILLGTPGNYTVTCTLSYTSGAKQARETITAKNCTKFLITSLPVCKNSVITPTNRIYGTSLPKLFMVCNSIKRCNIHSE